MSSSMRLSKKVNKDYFFHCIVAVDPDMSGDYGYVLQKAKEQFTYKGTEYPAGFIRAFSIWVASSGSTELSSFPPTCISPSHRRIREASTICTMTRHSWDSFPTAPLMPWKSDSRPQQHSLMEPRRPATDLRFLRPSA